jgi:cysteine desulfurase/selenocysteine lyase
MLVSKDDFIGLADIAHLATGGQPPLLTAHRKAFEEFARDKAIGMDGYERHWEVGMEVKSHLAAMTGLLTGDFALIGNASEGIVRAIMSLDWRPGDNAVVPALDFESGRFALAGLAELGIQTQFVAPRKWYLEASDLLDACNERTRIVYLSQVNALTGQLIDLKPISDALQQRGIVLLLDVSHALGIVPVDGTLCDFMVSSTYKFMMGPHSGVFAWNSRRRSEFVPQAVGWNSADPAEAPKVFDLAKNGRRAELGNSNHLDVYLLRESLKYLRMIPGAELSRHVGTVTERICNGLAKLGYEVITPLTSTDRGPNVCFAFPQPRRFVDEAAREGILLWGGDGRVRASAAAFVEFNDVDRFLDFAARYPR